MWEGRGVVCGRTRRAWKHSRVANLAHTLVEMVIALTLSMPTEMLQWVTIATQMWRLELIFYINVRKNKQTYLAPLLKAFNWRKCQELFHVGNIWAMPPWMMHKINAKPNLLSHGVILSFQPPVLASQLSGITPPLFVYPVLSPSTSVCCWSLGQGHWGNDHVVSWGLVNNLS